MSLPIEAVPNFVQDHVDHDADGDDAWNWWTRLHHFIDEQGYAMDFLRPVETGGVAASESAYPLPQPW